MGVMQIKETCRDQRASKGNNRKTMCEADLAGPWRKQCWDVQEARAWKHGSKPTKLWRGCPKVQATHRSWLPLSSLVLVGSHDPNRPPSVQLRMMPKPDPIYMQSWAWNNKGCLSPFRELPRLLAHIWRFSELSHSQQSQTVQWSSVDPALQLDTQPSFLCIKSCLSNFIILPSTSSLAVAGYQILD